MCRRVVQFLSNVKASHIQPRKIIILTQVNQNFRETGTAVFVDNELIVQPLSELKIIRTSCAR